MYYYYAQDLTAFEAVSPVFRHPCLFDDRNIPLGNVVLLAGQLYDSRDIEYHRVKKIAELTAAAALAETAGYKFGDLAVSCTRSAISDYNDLLKLAELENDSKAPVVFLTSAGPVTLPLDRFRVMCVEVGRYYKQLFFGTGGKIKAVKAAKTIDEIEELA